MTGIDIQTGELLEITTPEMKKLHTLQSAAVEAANAYAAYDRARLDYEAQQMAAQAEIERLFPHLKALMERVEALKGTYETCQQALREAALATWRALPDAGKTYLGGAVSIAETERVTHYDPAQALAWAIEMNRGDLIKQQVDKAALQKLVLNGLEIPGEVIICERIAETRIKESVLARLAGDA